MFAGPMWGNISVSPALQPPMHNAAPDRDWNWNGFPEMQAAKADGSDGTITPALRIWEEKVKPTGVAARR